MAPLLPTCALELARSLVCPLYMGHHKFTLQRLIWRLDEITVGCSTDDTSTLLSTKGGLHIGVQSLNWCQGFVLCSLDDGQEGHVAREGENRKTYSSMRKTRKNSLFTTQWVLAIFHISTQRSGSLFSMLLGFHDWSAQLIEPVLHKRTCR